MVKNDENWNRIWGGIGNVWKRQQTKSEMNTTTKNFMEGMYV